MDTIEFAVSWDYRCPFARNFHEHVAVALETFRKEHERGVADHNLWGVPTVIADGQAVFIRVMHRPQGDAAVARSTVDRALDLVRGWPELNEFKHTSIPR